MNEDDRTRAIESRYGAVARSALSGEDAAVRSVAKAFGYSDSDLEAVPTEANMGLSCGNPVALAGLGAGETVVDLGSGGGLDVLLAGRRVGPTGRAIGIDMTPEMVERARAGARKAGLANVEFHLARIDRTPLPDASADCVLSNCVINLAPDKGLVFREVFRILKPGGRLAISDIALRRPLPQHVAGDLDAHVGCIAGALLLEEYEALLREAGFEEVVITDTGADLNAYAQAGSGCCSAPHGEEAAGSSGCSGAPLPHDGLARLLGSFDANAFAASVRVQALKPSDAPAGGPQPPARAPEGEGHPDLKVYDGPLCCPTGVCGVSVDPVLPRFAADLERLRSRGHRVSRFNIAHDPEAFASNPEVKRLLQTEGFAGLPLIFIGGRLAAKGEYPTLEQLLDWMTVRESCRDLPIATRGAARCCDGGGCS